MTSLYPPCSITEVYPALIRIPPQERAGWVAQAEAGIELSDEQNARLGFHPSLKGGVLLPASAKCLKPEQLNFVCPPDSRGVLQNILKLGMEFSSRTAEENCQFIREQPYSALTHPTIEQHTPLPVGEQEKPPNG